MTKDEFIAKLMGMLDTDSPKIDSRLNYRLCTDMEIQCFIEHCYEWLQPLMRDRDTWRWSWSWDQGTKGEERMNTIRCKFKCESITTQDGWDYEKKTQKLIYSAKFRPVYSHNPHHINKKFWEATPVGTLEIGTIKQMPWEVGKEYYLDVSLAEDPDEEKL